MLQAGQRLDDYRIVNFFAGGGMGEIYLAEEVALARQVAIKVIRPEAIRYPDSEEARKVEALFQREAAAIARLNHLYILPLYKFGKATIDAAPLMYMVMPYCQERSLPEWMYAHKKTTLSAQEADILLRQTAEALQYAHDQGVIHLDVKPSNFLVRYPASDVSKLNLQLTDFGVAKFTTTNGMSQTVRGSLEYMAPEQWEGRPVFATDQYALAVMFYKLLTGEAPFRGAGFEQLWHQHRYSQPPAPSTTNPNLPPAIDAVFLRALAKNPQDRFPTVLAFADAYQKALLPSQYAPPAYTPYSSPTVAEPNRGAIQAPPPSLPPPPPRAHRNRIVAFVLVGAALLLILGGIIFAFSAYNQQQGNIQATATAQAQSGQATQNAINAQQTRDALATQNAQPPNIQGTYSGNYQFTTSSASGTIGLGINQQNGTSFGGTCTIDNNNFTINNGRVDANGNIQFSINATDSNGNNVTVTFVGQAQSSGGWSGSFSDTGGNMGNWNAS